jgi:predicted dehydrogenase
MQAAQLRKHVLAEKPLTVDLDEGKKILEVVKDNHVQLGVVFNYRSVDVAQQVHETLQQKKIGRIVSMWERRIRLVLLRGLVVAGFR